MLNTRPPQPWRLAIIASHPIQYYAPWFRSLATDSRFQIRVFYLFKPKNETQHDPGFNQSVVWDTDLLSGYDYEFVPNTSKSPSPNNFGGLRNPDLPRRLHDYLPDATLVYGYAFHTHFNLFIDQMIGRLKFPLLFRGDSHLLDEPTSSWKKRFILRWVFSRFAAVLVVGTANQAYFTRFGVPLHKFFSAPHVVDQSHFEPTEERLEKAGGIRKSLGIKDTDTVLLFAGKFVPKKRPDLLISAFLATDFSHVHLVLAGSGPLESLLRDQAQDHPRIHFLPFANQSEMPIRYLVGDVFVLPSEGRHETWGLAVNEAMHLARAAVVSTVVGCHLDLVHPRETGWVFQTGDQNALEATLVQISQLSRPEVLAVGQAAQQHAAQFEFGAVTQGLASALSSLDPRP